MRRALILTGLSLALCLSVSLVPTLAEACSCMAPPPPVEAARDVDAVFHAKLVSVGDGPKQYGFATKAFTFEVVRTFKGNLDPQVRVITADNSAACGRAYGDPGSEWLIYARIDDQGQLQDNLCSRTRAIADAAEDIAALEADAGTLDQSNQPPSDPGPGPAEDEPPPVLPEGSDPEQGPEPAAPSKKGCAVGDEPGGLAGLAVLLGLGLLLRRRD